MCIVCAFCPAPVALMPDASTIFLLWFLLPPCGAWHLVQLLDAFQQEL